MLADYINAEFDFQASKLSLKDYLISIDFRDSLGVISRVLSSYVENGYDLSEIEDIKNAQELNEALTACVGRALDDAFQALKEKEDV